MTPEFLEELRAARALHDRLVATQNAFRTRYDREVFDALMTLGTCVMILEFDVEFGRVPAEGPAANDEMLTGMRDAVAALRALLACGAGTGGGVDA